jgi:hypothetical protein
MKTLLELGLLLCDEMLFFSSQPLNSAGVFVAEFAILSMWASCLFLA